MYYAKNELLFIFSHKVSVLYNDDPLLVMRVRVCVRVYVWAGVSRTQNHKYWIDIHFVRFHEDTDTVLEV